MREQQPRIATNVFYYTWFVTTAFNAATELTGAAGLDGTWNKAYDVNTTATQSSSLTLNRLRQKNFFVPGLNYRFHVVVTEYYVVTPGALGLGFNSSANARCSYYVHVPPSKGTFVMSTTPYGTTMAAGCPSSSRRRCTCRSDCGRTRSTPTPTPTPRWAPSPSTSST